MTIIAQMFNGIQIDQVIDEEQIAGKRIPKGYVNATQMLKGCKKKKDLSSYFKLSSTQEYYAALFSDYNNRSEESRNGDTASLSSIEDITIIIKGGDNLFEQGTWLHPEAAIHFAQWLSPEFAVWANRVLRLVLNGDAQARNAEAHDVFGQYDEIWQEVRNDGKVTRRTLTDAIRDYYKRNPVEADVLIETKCKLTPWMLEYWQYGYPTDKMYLAIFGMKAKQLEAMLQVERHKSRNMLSRKCLKQVDWLEESIAKLIDNRDIHPSKAVSLIVEVHGIKPMSVEAKVVVPNV